VLYRCGSLIFADSGRTDYTLSELSQYGRGALSHNTIFIDGLSPSVQPSSWLHKEYQSVNVQFDLTEGEFLTTCTIQHDGFNRLYTSSCLHKRKFILSANSFKIEDHIFGSTFHNVKLRFHLAPGLTAEKRDLTSWSLMPLGARFCIDRRMHSRIVASQTTIPISGIYSCEYGITNFCTTLELESHLSTPSTLINTLTWN